MNIKTLRYLAAGLFIIVNFNPDISGKAESLPERRDWIKDVTKAYSQESWDLLMHYENLPAQQEAEAVNNGIMSTRKSAGTFHYLSGRTKLDQLASMSTNIHEIAHAFSSQNIFNYARNNRIKLDISKAEAFLYYSSSGSFFISFPLKSLFPSRELKAEIPRNLRTFRFDTYIDGNTSTQQEGIIGLLDELHAYYIESKFCYEMFEPYKTATGSEASGLFEWVHNSQSKMSAFFEFDFFIREYLLLMKNKYPSGYRDLVKYKPFIDAFKSIRKSYDYLVNEYQQKIKAEMNRLNASRKADIKLEGNMLWIKEGNSKTITGTPVLSDDIEILIPVLRSNRYAEIMRDFDLN